MKVIAILVIAFFSSVTYADGERRMHRFNLVSVGSLLPSESAQGCGCAFFYPPEKRSKGSQILSWSEGDAASMFVDGQLVNLNVAAPTPYSGRLGSKARVSLKSAETSATAELQRTWVCPAATSSCEVTEFQGSIELQHGKQHVAVPVWGSCGC